MRIESNIKLDFDDVLIRPKRSNAPSRKSVNLVRTVPCLHSPVILTFVPIIASNMSTTGTFQMSNTLKEHKMLTCIHKFYTLEELFTPATPFWNNSFYTLGIKEDDFKKFMAFSADHCPVKICVDIANGYTKYFVDKIKFLREEFPFAVIMAGNVCTGDMVQELLLSGADIVKIGIGSGSVCTTRLVTGVGYPQLSAIIECSDAAHGLGGLICADGGCRTPGDIVKAFGAGADFVMLGGMLAGTDECTDSHTFFGMSSKEAQEEFYGGVKDYCAPEGKSVEVKPKGPVENVLKEIMGGLRSACAYVGADSLKDFSKCTTFVRVNRTHNNIFDF